MIPPVGTTIRQHAKPEGLAVNMRERILARGMIEGKTKGWKHQQMMQRLASEIATIEYGEPTPPPSDAAPR